MCRQTFQDPDLDLCTGKLQGSRSKPIFILTFQDPGLDLCPGKPSNQISI